jgi:eukaryotic-like serine/threonine-protein kinase
MQPGEGSVLALAGAIADGAKVDWDQAESSAGDLKQRSVVQQLRRLADLTAAARARQATWGTFTIRAEIGGGTFGAVHRAWDPRLEREIALKLLHGSDDTRAEATVIREARLLARVQHQNVVTVHGADVIDGRVGIWMELIEGRTLKDILGADGPFGAHEAALIGRDLCRALAAVHRQDCVHGDVKAQNVMRQAGGRIVLMDFGAGGARAEAGPGLAGTPAYLAPEVLAGGVHTAQSDIYSLGVLLYHLVSGRFPVVGGSLDELRGVHARAEALPLRDVRPDLPEAFIRVVERATAPNPAARSRSAGALEELLNEALSAEGDLRSPLHRRRRAWYAAAALATLVAVGTGAFAAVKWSAGLPVTGADRSSVAILPFRNLTPSTDGEFLGDGITDELAAHLGMVKDLRVVSGASTRKFRDRLKTEIEIGAALDVSAVLDGSIRQVGDRIRIVGRLVDAQTGKQLWSESFESDTTDLFTTQSAIARKIAVALRGELTDHDADRLDDGRQTDYQAFALYAKGRYYWTLRNKDGLNKSLLYFQQAIERDPAYGLAYAGLADTYTQFGIYELLPRQEANARAYEAAQKAVQLGPNLAEAHAAMAYVHKNRFEWVPAEKSYKRAIELRPGYAPVHHYYSIFLTQHGRFAEAQAEINLALLLDPLAIGAHLQRGSLLVMARRYDEALKQYESARQMDPGLARLQRFIAEPLFYSGRYAEAEAALQRAARATPVGAEDQELKQDLGYLYAISGRRSEAQRVIEELTRRFEQAQEPVAASVAAIYTGLGNHDQAVAWLRRAREVNDPELGYIKVWPRWDPLREDARFIAILASLGFVPNPS